MRSCIMIGCPTHLVQELNVGTVGNEALMYFAILTCRVRDDSRIQDVILRMKGLCIMGSLSFDNLLFLI